MRCPYCGFGDSRVLDSRPTVEGHSIRRRRECGSCGKRFTTYERVDELPLQVVKKDGRREAFNRQKLLQGLLKACQKRPVSTEKLETIVEGIERELRNTMETEAKSTYIGELVMDSLRGLDEVAYVRFASVYREFRDAESFMEELKNLLNKKGNS
ncbi:MAG: Transcriptional repressor NrdR [Pelotomaculum sp. PtaB.Bin013]|uniref:Transcriptional repressor NrdR n=1 Tax=Pelotomaculum isophthalicicum JI TaxID=947010 RepID=A0A9X4JWS9_9FIRM|nr:transcriptional regulator NrdR [Pelotomaculum isophthalicicum]MDF9409913.1 transcriptional regulator NrdR [Pelotomaculum isophthalicicum JI]OPX90415.1 MAG: Transcriptional repressor NrdR [Pelotomaculum sp. PtaB.Bin013]